MLKAQINVGGRYIAKVSNKLTIVRVTNIREVNTPTYKRSGISYDVINESTGRKTTFRSAAKFRSEVKESKTDKSRLVSTADGIVVEAIPDIPEVKPVLTETATLSQLFQSAIDKEEQSRIPHLIVTALAGTGKTTTAIEGIKHVKGLPVSITPSEQQRDIWEAMALSKTAKSMALVAFSRSIADELKKRMPPGCEAMTLHSMGYKSVMRAFGRLEVSKWVILDILSGILGVDARDLRQNEVTMVQATEELVGHCKKNLVDGTNVEDLDRLCAHYQIDLNSSRDQVFELVPKVLQECRTPKGRITFDDMIWLPVIHKLPLYRYDFLIVDEAQDLNRSQQAMAKMAGNRLMLIGDENQAIFGFAGADCDSLPRMQRELGETERGCQTLPLTVTRRSGKAIVTEAQAIVPIFEAHESNHNGLIRSARYQKRKNALIPEDDQKDNDYSKEVRDGDFILCRVNAPLVSQCFRFLKDGRRANIQGRDIGTGLVSTIKKMKASNITELSGKLSDWYETECAKENKKRNPNEIRLIGLQDRYDCLNAFVEGMETVQAVINRIESVFTDDNTIIGIRLSSIHKAKGLEAKRVYLLQPEGCTVPHPMAKTDWQKKQEWNLKYVAITRAIEELVYVS